MNLAKLGLGALSTAQYKLKTSAHNINNAATEGYNRQTVRQQTAGAQATGGGYVGRGVMAVTIDRAYDNFLFTQLVNARGHGAALKAYGNEISHLDTLFADRTVGVAPALAEFFNSINAVASSPFDPAAREEMLGRANNLATQIRNTSAYIDQQRNNVNTQVTTVVAQINSYVERIHDMNNQIVKARASATQHEPNDLLDQRDQLVAELNQLVNVQVFEQDGRFNLAIGNGQVVLGGDTIFPLRAQRAEDDPQRMVVAYTAKDQNGNIQGFELDEAFITGGTLGGLIQYRREVLDDVQNNLGRLAVGLSMVFNEVHRQGADLSGNSGINFFGELQPKVIPSQGANSSLVQVSFADASLLTADDYRVEVTSDQAGYIVTNLTTGARVVHTDLDQPLELDGLRFTFENPEKVTDTWLVQPTRDAGSNISVAITDPAQIAARDVDAGVSNGDNALALARLQVDKTLGAYRQPNGEPSAATMNFNEAFSQIVNRVAVLSQQNKTASTAQESLIQQTYAAQQEVSGVNLNEEYVNLEQYMEQFRAASKLIEVASSMFDTLLSMR